jgi:hypothetical protein
LEGEQEEQLSPAGFASIQCGMLLQVLLRCISAQACAKNSAMQLQQLQSVAYTVQLVEATVRLSADPEALPLAEACQGAAQLQPRRLGADKVCGGTALAVVESALRIILKAGQTVLGSLQGQQLLQSCTSLLLTCCSLLQRLGSAASPVDMSLCVHLLQLLQHSDALVTGGSSCSMFQSLAAGLAAAGRTAAPRLGGSGCSAPAHTGVRQQQLCPHTSQGGLGHCAHEQADHLAISIRPQ